MTRFKVPAASVVEIRIHPVAEAEEGGEDQGQARLATPAPLVVAQVPRSRAMPGLPTVAEGELSSPMALPPSLTSDTAADEVPIALPRGQDSVSSSSGVRRSASQKAKGSDLSRMRPPPLRRTRSRSLDSCDSPIAPRTPRSGYTTDSEHTSAAVTPGDASTSTSSIHLSGALNMDDRRARAAAIGAGGLQGLERLTTQLEAQRALRDRLAAKSATSSGFPGSPSSPASSVHEALERSSLRSGTPDVEALALKASQDEEAARFRLQRRTPPPPLVAPLTVAIEPAPAAHSVLDPLKRAANPICNVLEKVTSAVGNCKLAPSSSKDDARSGGKEVMKTVETTVTFLELDSRAVAREDDARLTSQSWGSERSRYTDHSTPTTVSTSIGSTSGGTENASSRSFEAKALTSGGYDSVISGVTMAQAINKSNIEIDRAVPVLRRDRA